jgi:hypothetical protein
MHIRPNPHSGDANDIARTVIRTMTVRASARHKEVSMRAADTATTAAVVVGGRREGLCGLCLLLTGWEHRVLLQSGLLHAFVGASIEVERGG